MKLPFVVAGAVLLVAVICGPVAALLAGCASGPHQQNVILATEYGAELNACVATSATRADSEACRCKVNQRWQRPCAATDGGLLDGY